MNKTLLLILLLIPALAMGQITPPDNAAAIAVDTDGDGDVDGYAATAQEGANITFVLTGSSLNIAGPAGSGTADSAGVDTNGVGAPDAYVYSAAGAAFVLREGANMTLTVGGDTITFASTGGGSGSTDTVWVLNDAGTDSLDNIGNGVKLKWSTGIDVTLSGQDATVSVDKSELSLAFSDLSGAATDDQIPNTITISFADSTDKISFETAQDRVGEMVAGNTETNITVTYDDTGGKLNFSVTSVPFADSANAVTDEGLQDKAGAMFSGNTETGITATYQDADGTIDLIVSGLDSSFINPLSIGLYRLAQDEASLNQVMTWNGSKWVPAAAGAGTGSGDTLIISVPEEYSIVSNRIKLKEGTLIDFTREDSTDYDVIKINVLPDGSKADTSILVTGVSPLNGGGNLQADRTVGMADQSLTGQYIDSTASNVAFDEAYKKTSAVPESAYATEQYVGTKADTGDVWTHDMMIDTIQAYSAQPESIGVDEGGTPAFEGYLKPPFLREGPNIIFGREVDTLTITGDSTSYNTEAVQDKAGALLGGTETGMSATYNDASNQVDFVVNAASGEIADQTIIKDDIDTTSSNIPFGSAYRGTTASAESLLATANYAKKAAGDSAAAVRANTHDSIFASAPLIIEDSLDGYLTDTAVRDAAHDTAWTLPPIIHDSLFASMPILIEDSLNGYPNTAATQDIVHDSLTVIDSTHVADNKLAPSDIDWAYEWYYLDMVHGWTRPTEDSVYLMFPAHDISASWLLRAKAGDMTAGDRDTLFVSGFLPFDCVIDSIQFTARNTGDSGLVNWQFYGPDVSSFTNTTDSLFNGVSQGAWAQYSAASWTLRTPTFHPDVTASAGYRYAVRFITDYRADNNYTDIGWVRIRVRR